MPVTPPITNIARKPSANSIGVRSRIAPRHIVARQSKYSTPAGTSSDVEVSEKYRFETAPVVNM
jgi:hypothetical protein